MGRQKGDEQLFEGLQLSLEALDAGGQVAGSGQSLYPWGERDPVDVVAIVG